MNTHYDHRTGVLSTWNPEKYAFTTGKVKYLDANVPPTHLPKIPDRAYLEIFARIASTALLSVNSGAKVGFVIDEFRLDGFSGFGLFEGDFYLYVVRKDKHGAKPDGPDAAKTPSDAGYRYEMRAFDSIKTYEYQGADALQTLFIRDMLQLDTKQ